MQSVDFKIVSGGQTGVDRAALDFALENNIPCGGRCPKGRPAEDGIIPSKYPLKETAGKDYSERTRKNIEESDATLVIYKENPDEGTKLTITLCNKLSKPCFIVNLSSPSYSEKVFNLIAANRIKTLNIAGPRESNSPGIYIEAFKFLSEIFQIDM